MVIYGYNLIGWFIYKQKGYPTLESIHIYVLHGDQLGSKTVSVGSPSLPIQGS